MAKVAKKNKTEQEALDAVEEALSIEFSDADISDEDLKALEEKLSDVTNELRIETGDEATETEDAQKPTVAERLDATARFDDDLDFPDAPPTAANDAHEAEIAGLLYSFRQQPKSRVFLWAAVLSAVWLAACAYYGYVAILPGLESPVTFASATTNTSVVILALVAFLPLLPIWSFAFFIRRAHEMRHAARSMMEAALKLLQPEKVATESVTTVGNAIRREVAAIGDGVEQAIARAGELEFMVQKEVMSLERSYGDSEMRLKRLVDDITNEREEVVNHAEKLRSSITNSQTGFTADIEAAGGKIEEQIKTLTDMLNQSLSERGHSITTELSERSTEFITLLEQSGKQVEEKLSIGKEQLGSEVTKRAKEISEVIGLSGQAVANMMESRFTQIQSADAEISAKLEAGRIAFDETLELRKGEIASVLDSANQSVSGLLQSSGAVLAEQSNATLEKLEASRLALRDEMTEQSNQLQAASQQAANALASAAETGAEAFGQRSDKVLSQIEDSLAVRAGDFENRIAEVGTKIDEQLAEKIAGIDSTLTTSGSNLVSALGMRTEALGKVLQERTTAIGDTIASRLSGFGEQMTGHVDTAVTKLSEQTASLYESTKSAEQSILERTKRIEDVIREGDIQLETTAENSSQVAKQAAAQIGNSMKAAEDALTETIATGAKGFVETVDQKQDQLGKVIETGMSVLDEKITEKTTNLASKLNQGAHRIGSELEDKSRAAIEKMEENVRALENRLKVGSEEIAEQFTAGNQVLEDRMSAGKENLLQSVAQSVADAGNAIDDKASKISTLLNERAKLINDTLGTTLVETQRQLEDKTGEFTTLLREQSEGLVDLIETQAKPAFDGKTEEFNALLRERTAELRNLIDNDAKPIVGALEQAGEEISSKLSGLSNTIATDATTLFASLNESSGSLEKLIASSTQNLDSLQNQLAMQASNFASVVGESNAEIERTQSVTSEIEGRIRAMSEGIAQNMSAISQKLDVQSSALSEATALIDNAQNNLQGTVEAKQASLEELARGLVGHTEELNRTMQTFGGAISQLVDDVTQRSRGVGSTVAAEISSSIDDATARFTDAVEAMRGAAATMRVELEETREQMRRGVLELPDETAQNANAMRRVVTDQIAALRDLSAIVEQSGKMLDTVQPIAPAVQTPPIAPRAPAAAQQPRNLPPFPPVTSASRATAPAAPSRPQAAPVATSPAPQRGNNEAGWVSDLLKRASNDSQSPYQRQPQPDNRAPHHVVDSLNSLSMDIANAIDHETSVDLWERYQRGETNVFTRRLYTLQGQQTFDEIRSKFGSDREFRAAVERYIDDFERLLQDASRNDPSGAMAQSYLNSDTGKVYTMLAHASGRLGNQ